MGVQKLSPFLALGILLLYQTCSLQAAPFRSAIESSPDPTALSEEEARLLLANLVKDFVQMKAREQELELEPEGPSMNRPRSKRCTRLSTCLLGAYFHQMNKLLTQRPTPIGVGAPGKKRGVASDLKGGYRPQQGRPLDSNVTPPSAF
ncbi:calcitonin-like [Tenrec ecaudatus]|uniref:calcitonin-like n=1 Tax=Tenrec ecaudatus TaxID=94439 RepID=UPI003F59969A